jgi:hypothetical protein
MRLKLTYDKLLSILHQFCIQFQLAQLHRGDIRWRGRGGVGGRVVQVDPINPTLKAPGAERL